MTEYRIVCDHVRTDNKGHAWVLEARHPIGKTGSPISTVFKDFDEAERCLEKYKGYGEAYEKSRVEMATRYPGLYDTIIRQINYRIQRREVTDWE